MIEADRNLLKASLTSGLLEIQQRLVDNYTKNLQSLGTMGALIGGFALSGVQEINFPNTGAGSLYNQIVYGALITTALSVSLLVVSQCTIVTINGKRDLLYIVYAIVKSFSLSRIIAKSYWTDY